MVDIAFVVASQTLGGHEFQSAELVRQRVREHQVTVYLNADKFVEVFRQTGVHLVVQEGGFFQAGWLLPQILRGLRHRTRIRRQMAKHDEVIVCAGAVEAGVQMGVALAGTGKATLYLPFLYDRRVVWGAIGSIYTSLLRGLLNLYPRIVTINRIQACLLRPCYRGEVTVSRNVIPAPAPLQGTVRAPRLVSIGRLDRQKQIAELIQMLDSADNPVRELLVIGDGPERGRIEALAASTRYVKVTLLGWLSVEQQALHLSVRDILIVNSLIEGEPMVIREAKLRGMRVLARDIPGVRGVTKPVDRFSEKLELISLLIAMIRLDFCG